MSDEEIFEVLGDIHGYMNDVLGFVQMLEDEADRIGRFPELAQLIEDAYDLSVEVFDNYGEVEGDI